MTCSVDTCDRPVHGQGICAMHRRRMRKYGTTDDTRTSPLVRFWPHVVTKGDGCWEWTGSICPSTGYGRLLVRGRRFMAHRYAYELLVGEIPDGLQIDHLCRVRTCVNPDHLEPVTLGENVLRGAGITAQNARKTHCKRGHPFDDENTYWPPHRPGTRWCRECRRMHDRDRRARIRYSPEVGP